MDKILTIIIPTYNMEKYLRKCLDSLIISEENMSLLEVLVINDGSKDSSSLIAHEYESRFPQTFRVIDKENGNYGSCINRGLKEATGRYVKILDADDSFDTDTFTSFLMEISKIKVDLLMSDFNMVDQSGNPIKHYNYNLPSKKIFDASFMPANIAMWMHAVAYKTEILRAMGYHQTEGISYTDQEWIFLPMSQVRTIWYFPSVVYNYLVGRDGQTIDKNVFIRNIKQEVKGLFVMSEEYSTFIPTAANKDYLKERIKKRLTSVYMSYLVRYPDRLSIQELKDIDRELENNSEVYKISDEVYFHPKIRIHYIKRWREKRFGNKLLFIFLKYMEKIIDYKQRLKAKG